LASGCSVEPSGRRDPPDRHPCVVAESLGFEKGLGQGFCRALVFTGVITAMILIATIVAAIQGHGHCQGFRSRVSRG
jgi:hypothetical protein